MTTESNSGMSDPPHTPLPVRAANDDLQVSDYRPRSPAETLEPSRAPEPPEFRERRRTHPIITILNGIMTLLMVGLIAFGAFIYFVKIRFDEAGPLQTSTVVVIPKGEGVNGIAERLEREGVISDRRIFVASVIYFNSQEKLKAGEYEVRKHASMREVLDLIVRGKSILYKVTIPEGLTSEQAIERLKNAEHLTGEITRIPAEGSLLPDTYKYSRGMTRQELIERMQSEQRKFVQNLWNERAPDLPIKTKEEAIILASIVEKETARADERGRIAGVFVNRLRKGMKLQSDPTIIYGLVGGKGKLGRPLLKSELLKETPYNTYHIKGLPPGPIANPGRAAIEAVLNPAKTKDLFFVADGTGGHAFAPTLAAHNRNVAKWREVERKMREEERAKEEALKKQQELEASGGQAVVPETQTPAPGNIPDLSVTGIPGLSVGGGGYDTPLLNLAPPSATVPAITPPVVSAQETPPATAQPPAATQTPAGDGTKPPLPKRNPKLR